MMEMIYLQKLTAESYICKSERQNIFVVFTQLILNFMLTLRNEFM